MAFVRNEENVHRNLVGKPDRKDCFEDIVLCGRIILE